MKFSKYVKDNLINIVIYIATVILIALMLVAFKVPIQANITTVIVLIFSSVVIILNNYFRKEKFYKQFRSNLEKLDKKYLILETLPEPNTYEEKIIVEALYEINKSIIENINEYYKNTIEFKEFVEIWIHEVKIPISSMVLKCHNNKEKYDKSFFSLIRRLDNSIDEILYYVRSENTEKDFAINEIDLKEVVRNVSIKNKDDLLENNVMFETDLKAKNINTDKKWLEFILNQIINNSIKYKKDKESIIKIESSETKDKVILEIYDNGIGIPEKDLKRVFEKSFTGANGRNKAKSTGMGLYIIKNLCNKLGHKIYIESEEDKYTKVILEFGKNNIYKI